MPGACVGGNIQLKSKACYDLKFIRLELFPENFPKKRIIFLIKNHFYFNNNIGSSFLALHYHIISSIIQSLSVLN